MSNVAAAAVRKARFALGLLLAINLFNYIDRQILSALEPQIRATFFLPGDVNAMTKTGALGMVFLVTYMLAAPALGWLADRFSRWIIIGTCVIFWSLASGASGLAATFGMLVLTRVLIGIGEGGYGPAAPTILSDLFPIENRGRILAIFCAAIPVGSALGYVLGGAFHEHWRWAFYILTPPGLLLGLLCFWQRDPRGLGISQLSERKKPRWEDYRAVLRTRSFLFNCAAQTAMTFALGGLAFWMPAYLQYRGQPPTAVIRFGIITVAAGLISTLLGGVVADRLRKRFPGSYFLVSGLGMLIAFPLFLGVLYTPFPLAWFFVFSAVFFVFLNTGPSNTALANVCFPSVRATAFALNIFVIHFLGDAAAFPTIGYIGGHANMHIAFLVVSGMMALSGVLWLLGMRYLPADTARVEAVPV
ncbi:MAG: MFS transporter [Chthoniobacterales bacterium]